MTDDRFLIEVDFHPTLRPAAFTTRFPRPLGRLVVPEWLTSLIALGAVLNRPFLALSVIGVVMNAETVRRIVTASRGPAAA